MFFNPRTILMPETLHSSLLQNAFSKVKLKHSIPRTQTAVKSV